MSLTSSKQLAIEGCAACAICKSGEEASEYGLMPCCECTRFVCASCAHIVQADIQDDLHIIVRKICCSDCM